MPEHQKQFALIRKKMFFTTVGLSAAFVFSLALAAYSLVISHDKTVQKANILCVAHNDTNDAIKKILVLAEAASVKQARSPQQRMRAVSFYEQAYKLLDDIKCGGK